MRRELYQMKNLTKSEKTRAFARKTKKKGDSFESPFWSEWQVLHSGSLLPQAKGCGFLRDIASNTCFFVRKNWYKVRCVLLPPGSPVLKVVKYVVVKSAPDLMWSSIKGADNFLYGNCGQSMWSVSNGFRHLRLSYCTSLKWICQEVSGVNIWDAVIKDKG
jgi:hypothetical protein